MKRASMLIWLFRVLELVILAGAAMLMVLYVWIHSATGMKWIADRVTLATKGQVEITGMTGRLPRSIHADKITFRDREHTLWLTATGVDLVIRLHPLLDGVLEIQSVSAGQINWLHMPDYRGERREVTPEKQLNLSGIQKIHVGTFALRHFHIATNILGHHVDGQLHGAATWTPPGALSAMIQAQSLINHKLGHEWRLNLRRSNNVVEVSRLNIHAVDPPGDRLELAGIYAITNAAITGTGKMVVADLSSYRDFHKLDLSGDAAIDFQVRRAAREMPWQCTLQGHSTNLRFAGYTSENLHLDGKIEVSPDVITYEANSSAALLQYQDWLFIHPYVKSHATISAGTNEEASAYQFDVNTRGRYTEATDFTLTGRASLAVEKAGRGVHLEVSALHANWNDAEVVVLAPARVSSQSRQITMTAPSFLIDQLAGRAFAQVVDGALDQVDISMDGNDLSSLLEKCGWDIPFTIGHVAGALRASSLKSDPTGTVSLLIDAIHLDHEHVHLDEPARLWIDLALDPDLITVHSTLLHPLVDTFTGWAEVPIQPTGGWMPITWSDQHAYQAYIQLSARLEEVTEDRLTGTSMRGHVGMELHLCGTGSTPDYNGYFFWNNGQYRNATLGMFLDQIQLRLEADQRDWILKEASARDGGRGVIGADGGLQFDKEGQPHWSFSLQLRQATLFRLVRTELPLTGNISATGSPDHSRIGGELWLEPFRFNIPRRLPPSVLMLDVTEINHPDPARNTPLVAESARAKKTPRSRATDLDIRVKTRRSFELVGRGLQSEWRGAMRLTGNNRAPNLSGSAEVVRGHAMLLGRRFNLDDGRLELTGAIPPKPQLNITASTRVADTVARLVISGPVNQPDIRLQSDPMLPENEIMALILFGRSAETMSPWQAIALANGLRILGGGGGDVVNFMEASQSLLRVDQIDIKQDEEGEGFSSLTIGKYVGRRLYVEGEKGFGNAENVFTATLELSPRLILETETSPRIREGISIYWRKDY